MFRACCLLRSLRIPASTQNQYFFDPLLLGFGSRRFNPEHVGKRVTQEEFESMRVKLIEAGGPNLRRAKCLFITMCIIACIVICGLIDRLVVRILYGPFSLSKMAICMMVIFVVNNSLNCAWKRYSAASVKAIQEVLDQQNKGYYKSKGIEWKISANLKYIQISFSNEMQYSALQSANESVELQTPGQDQSEKDLEVGPETDGL